jgi:uncharacterized DUF497 family protein
MHPMVIDLDAIEGFELDEGHSGLESRWHALGQTDARRLLHLTFTLRQAGRRIRVISARDMHRKERVIYGQAN